MALDCVGRWTLFVVRKHSAARGLGVAGYGDDAGSSGAETPRKSRMPTAIPPNRANSSA
jgi:hypothetical protein